MNRIYLVFFVFYIGFIACNKSDEGKVEPENEQPTALDEYNATTEGLKDYYAADYFDIGAAIEPNAIDNANDVELLERHFNSLTAENAMKWSSLQPTEGVFNYTNADEIVNYAQANGMKVRGHTLCWHNQVPDWVFEDNGVTASKELVLERLRTHISYVMTHFKGKVYAWDVVNEAIDDGESTYKSTKWYDICGENYIIEAFKAARQADPDVKLFYNDYSAVNPTKRDKIYYLLQKLNDQNLVDGVGLQGHWNLNWPSDDDIKNAFDKYKSLGIEIQITELDVSIYTSSEDNQSAYTYQIENKQALAYDRLFTLFRMYQDNITSVTFWGISDNHTWLDNFPVTGRKNYPFLFGTDYNPKKAYFEVIDF